MTAIEVPGMRPLCPISPELLAGCNCIISFLSFLFVSLEVFFSLLDELLDELLVVFFVDFSCFFILGDVMVLVSSCGSASIVKPLESLPIPSRGLPCSVLSSIFVGFTWKKLGAGSYSSS